MYLRTLLMYMKEYEPSFEALLDTGGGRDMCPGWRFEAVLMRRITHCLHS